MSQQNNATVRLAVIGCGHWGPNHIRVFSAHRECQVVAACDPDHKRLQLVRESFPEVEATTEPDEVIQRDDVDAVVVATPTATHYELVRRCLEVDKDVLCEKPLCVLPTHGEELVELAEARGRILMVGHVYFFNRGIVELSNYLRQGQLGRILYAQSVRSNAGPIREDVSVLYDLASHDVGIFNFLFDASPEVMAVQGGSFINPEIADVVFLNLVYPGTILVNLQVSWVAARKVRQLSVVGSSRMAVWDELAAVGPVQIAEKVSLGDAFYKDFGEFQSLSREGEVIVPRISAGEPLRAQAEHFLECVQQRKPPFCDGRRATEIVHTLHRAEQQLTLHRSGRHP